MRLKRRNKRNDRERQERQEKQVETTIEELKDKGAYVYFDNEEELQLFIKHHKIKNFEYLPEARTIKFKYGELLKEND